MFTPPRQANGRFRPGTKYEAWMPDRVVELMAEGASKAEVAVDLGLARDTLYDWTTPGGPREKPTMSAAMAYGEQLSEAWWMRVGRAGTVGMIDGFNPSAYVWQTKNRFGWKDRVEIGQDRPLQVAVVDYSEPSEVEGDADRT